MEPASRAYDRTPLLIAAAVVIAIFAIASVDFALTSGRIPVAPSICDPPSPICENARAEGFDARLDRAIELENGFGERAWAYAVAALIAVLAAVSVAVARNPRARRREVFTDLGVGAVAWLLVGFGLGLAESGGLLEAPSKPVFYPPVALIAVAAGGTLLTRRPHPEAPDPDHDPTAGPAVRWLGYSATTASVALAWIGAATRPDPCSGEGLDAGVDVAVGLAVLLALVAVASGIASLFQRRWIGALVMLLVPPFVALLALFTGACWN